jgi:hypothetical protein
MEDPDTTFSDVVRSGVSYPEGHRNYSRGTITHKFISMSLTEVRNIIAQNDVRVVIWASHDDQSKARMFLFNRVGTILVCVLSGMKSTRRYDAQLGLGVITTSNFNEFQRLVRISLPTTVYTFKFVHGKLTKLSPEDGIIKLNLLFWRDIKKEFEHDPLKPEVENTKIENDGKNEGQNEGQNDKVAKIIRRPERRIYGINEELSEDSNEYSEGDYDNYQEKSEDSE